MKWQAKQKIKRIAALLLSFVLFFDALEISAPAPVVRAMEESFGAFCAVTSFAELPQELREQTLPLGAQESDVYHTMPRNWISRLLYTFFAGKAMISRDNRKSREKIRAFFRTFFDICARAVYNEREFSCMG